MCLVRARIVRKRHDFHTAEPQFLYRPLYNQADLLSATVGPTVNESIVHLSVAFWPFPPHDDGPVQPTEMRGRYGTHPVPSYSAVRHHSSAEEGRLISALY